jgi:hypothetical protein
MNVDAFRRSRPVLGEDSVRNSWPPAGDSRVSY